MMNLILIFDLVYNCKFFWSGKERSCRPIRQPLSQWLNVSMTYFICKLNCTKNVKDLTEKLILFVNWITSVIEGYKEEWEICMTFRKKCLTGWLQREMYDNHTECMRAGRSAGCKLCQQLHVSPNAHGQFLKFVVKNIVIILNCKIPK